MKNDERIKKADIMRRLKERDTTNPVLIKEFCWLLRQNGLSHSQGYFHYTTWGRLKKMLATVDVGEKEKKRLFFLSASLSMNDTQEAKPGVYLASFSFGKEEEVAMWTNYGVPKREAVRIRFPLAAMTRWANENTSDKITIYVRENENGPFHALDVKPAEIYFADVAYYGRNDPSEKTKRDAVRYKGENFSLKETKWREHVRKTDDSLLFKKRGWAYEREVRLIVRFDDAAKVSRYGKIALPFDSVYEAMLNAQQTAVREKSEEKKSVMLGPWSTKETKLDGIDGIRSPGHSSFEGELRMRSNCDACDLYGKKDCQCELAEWRLWN